MSDTPVKDSQQEQRMADEKWVAQMKRIMFAGIGAVAMAQEEVEALVKKLVQKGAIAEQEGRKWIKEVVEKKYKETKDRVQSIEKSSLENVEELIKKISLPTKAQFEKLSGEVEELRKKVEELCNKLR